MNIPEINPYEDQAIDAIVTVINQAKSRLNIRQNLFQLARSRGEIAASIKVPLHHLHHPLGRNCEKFLVKTIEKKWRLTPTFSYIKRFMGSSRDESSNFYYFEAVFSQPTVSYPIPQANASVYFRLQDNHMGPPQIKTIPSMIFRIEGHNTDHDVRYVTLTPDWLLAVIKMKLKLFKRIEGLELFLNNTIMY